MVFDKSFVERLSELLKDLDKLLEGKNGRIKFKQILLYLLKASKKNYRTKIVEIMQEMSENTRKAYISVYEDMLNEGIEKGKAEGKAEGINLGIEKGELRKTIRGVRSALNKQKYSIEEIAELFEVSEAFVVKVQLGEIQEDEDQ